jgi:hypothetical protein
MASKGRAPAKPAKDSGELPRAADLDDIAEEVAAAMEEAPKPPKPPLPAPEVPPSRAPGTPAPVSLTFDSTR